MQATNRFPVMPTNGLAGMAPQHHIGRMLGLKRRTTSATSGEWSDEEFDVFDDGAPVGRILRSHAASPDHPWLWTIDRRLPRGAPNRGYAESLEAAMARLSSQWKAAGPPGG